MRDFFKYRAYVLLALIILGAMFFSGYTYGKKSVTSIEKITSVTNKDGQGITVVDFSPFWKAWAVINDKYVPTNSTTTERASDQTRVYGAIQGMVASLGDPYTIFFPPVESKSFNDEIGGQIEGVGMEIDVRDGVLTVIAPVKDSPAYKAGIKSGDKVLTIDDKLTTGLRTEQAVNLIRGKK